MENINITSETVQNENTKNGISLILLEIIGLVLLIPLILAFSGLVNMDWLKVVLGIVGSAGLPVWGLVISEKLHKTGTPLKHLLGLLFVAIASGYPYYLLMRNGNAFSAQNIFSIGLTAFIFCGMIIVADKFKQNLLKGLFFAVVFLFAFFIIQSDWAVALIPGIIVYLYKFRFSRLCYYLISFSAVFLIIGILTWGKSNVNEAIHMISMSGGVLSLPLLKRYDPDKKITNKTVSIISYVFLPVLFMILYALKILILIE